MSMLNHHIRMLQILALALILNKTSQKLKRLRGFPGIWVFFALASPHFNVVEVCPRNSDYQVPLYAGAFKLDVASWGHLGCSPE